MKKKNRAFYRYFIPVIYAVFVYILWELTGTLVAYVVGKVMDNWEETLYSSYISMLFNEVLTFVIMFVLFRKNKIVGFLRLQHLGMCRTFKLYYSEY